MFRKEASGGLMRILRTTVQKLHLPILLLPLLLAACASNGPSHAPTSSEAQGGVYYESAYNDHNQAPQKFQIDSKKINNNENTTLDPMHLRTQADYYFSVGEAYSFDGNVSKAIESFKMVLIYDQKTARVPLRISAEYAKLGLLSESLEYCQMAIEKDPVNVEAHVLMGGLYSTMKQFDKAIEQYEIVLKLNPKDHDALMFLGAVYAEIKDYPKSIQYFEKLVSDDEAENLHLAHYYLGRVYTEAKTKDYFKKAEINYKKALNKRSDYAEAAISLSLLYSENKMDQQSIDILKEFTKENGPNLRIAEVLGAKYLEMERTELALEQYEFLEAHSEDVLNLKVKVALLLMESKQYLRAVNKLNEILKIVPESDKIRFYLAAVFEELNDHDKALEHYRKIPTSSNFYMDSVTHAVYLLRQGKKTDEALELAKKAFTEKTDQAQAVALYASLLDEKSQYLEAESVLNQGLTHFPENVQLTFMLGTIFDRLGKKNDVIATMKKVVTIDPNHVQGLNYIAFTYADLGKNLDEAERLARKALALDGDDGYIMDTLGWVMFKRGKVKESIPYLESAFKKQPTEAVIADHLGDAYKQHQLMEKAKKMYQKAVELEIDLKKADEIRMKITSLEKQERLPASKIEVKNKTANKVSTQQGP